MNHSLCIRASQVIPARLQLRYRAAERAPKVALALQRPTRVAMRLGRGLSVQLLAQGLLTYQSSAAQALQWATSQSPDERRAVKGLGRHNYATRDTIALFPSRHS